VLFKTLLIYFIKPSHVKPYNKDWHLITFVNYFKIAWETLFLVEKNRRIKNAN